MLIHPRGDRRGYGEPDWTGAVGEQIQPCFLRARLLGKTDTNYFTIDKQGRKPDGELKEYQLESSRNLLTFLNKDLKHCFRETRQKRESYCALKHAQYCFAFSHTYYTQTQKGHVQL